MSLSKEEQDKITGTQVRMLKTSTYIYTVYYYDEEGKVIKEKSGNISAGSLCQMW